jgi:hypothetical protein
VLGTRSCEWVSRIRFSWSGCSRRGPADCERISNWPVEDGAGDQGCGLMGKAWEAAAECQ